MAIIKIPADVSQLRRKLIESAARRKVSGTVTQEPVKKPGDRKAGQEAADARKKARAAEQSVAEKDIILQDLQEKLAAAEKRAADAEPLADKWNKHDHRRKELLIAKFPKEEQGRVRKLDADALEMLVDARGFGEAAKPAGQIDKVTGSKFSSVDELSALAKTDVAAYNKGMDDIVSGAVKLDQAGKVIA